MYLSIRNLKLQADVIRDNKNAIKKLAQDRINDISLLLGHSPNDKLVLQINEALKRNVKIFKTSDFKLLNLAFTIEKHFKLRVSNEI